MKHFFIIFFLALNVLIADTYWLNPAVLGSLLLIVPIFLIGLGEHNEKLFRYRKLVVPFIVFFTYIYIVDVIREGDFIVNTYLYILNIMTICVALFFTNKAKYIHLYFVIFLFCNFFAQLLQVLGFHFTSVNILGPLGFMGHADANFFDLSRGFRYSGLFINLLPLAFLAGVLIVYFWLLYNQSKKKIYLLFLIISIAVVVLTNTRAVIFAILPIIICVDVWVNKRLSYKFILLGSIFLLFFAFTQSKSGVDSDDTTMKISGLESDPGVADRVQANVYASIGVLELSPFFGLRIDEQDAAIWNGYTKIGLFYGDRFHDHVTFHNQPLFYFRVYGLIGFLLFFWAYWRAIIFAYRQSNPTTRFYLLVVLIFFFVYTLSHNMKVNYLIFWLALSAGLNNSPQPKERLFYEK